MEKGRQSVLRCLWLPRIAVFSGNGGAGSVGGRAGLVAGGGGGLLGLSDDPPLPDPEAGVLSGGHLASGCMSMACVDLGEELLGVG